MLKRCTSCRAEKDTEEFYKQGNRRQSKCKPCLLQHQKTRYDPEKNRNYSIKRRYGVSAEEYAAMLLKQGGSCAICNSTETVLGRPLYVDHNHNTGRVRGLLCHKCNTGLGSFRDSPLLLKAATTYLESPHGANPELYASDDT